MIKKNIIYFLVFAFLNFVIVPIRMRLIAYRKKWKPSTLSHFLLSYAFLSFLLLSSCAPYSLQAPVDPPGPYTYGPASNVDFRLSSYEAGAEASHTLSFDIKQGDLQTEWVRVYYGPYGTSAFVFKGFLAVGPPNTQIGEYFIDFDFDGRPDFTIPLRSIDEDNAYADINFNGNFDGDFSYLPSITDVWIHYTITGSSVGALHTFETHLPLGGDGNPGLTGVFSGRVTAVMYAGILTNPPFGGQYEVSADFTAVNPGTGTPYIYDSRTVTITGEPGPLTITSGWLITGVVNKPYVEDIDVVGGTPPYRYEIVAGSLPTGLTLNPDTGLISGTPTIAGTSTFTVKVTDAVMSTDTQDVYIPIIDPSTIDIPGINVGGGGGGCFIATAAYGSALHPHVNALREFRDNRLKKAMIGRAIISLYERVSPPLAAVIAKHDTLRLVSRLALAPLVYAVIYPKAHGICAGLLLVGVSAARLRRRSNRI